MEFNNDSGIVKQAVNRTNRNLFLASLACFIIVIGVFLVGSSYWVSLIAGPKTLTHDELLGIQSIDLLPKLVTVQSEESYDTGYEQYILEDDGSRTSENFYIAMLIGDDNFLLVEAPPEAEKLEYSGALINIPSDVQADVLNALVSEVPDLDGLFLPVMLTTQDHKTAGYVGLVIMAVIFIAGVVGMARLFARTSNINQHPIYKSLGRYGDPQRVIKQIESEMVLGSNTVGNLKVTPKWAISSTATTFDAVYLKDAVWMYKMVTQHRTNGIPTGKSFKVVLHDKYGHQMELSSKKNIVDEMLNAIYQRAPWMIMGFSDDLQSSWNDNQGRLQMIAAVEQRQE